MRFVRSGFVVIMFCLFIFYVPPIHCLCWSLLLDSFILCPFRSSNHFDEEERAGCFSRLCLVTVIVP